MTRAIEIEIPEGLAALKLPSGVQKRLRHLLDKQDREGCLSAEEREEAEGLVELSEVLSLIKLRNPS